MTIYNVVSSYSKLVNWKGFLILLCLLGNQAVASFITLSPIYPQNEGHIQWTGNVGRVQGNGDNLFSLIDLGYKGRFISQGYIWKPWFSQLQFRANAVGAHQQSNSSNSNTTDTLGLGNQASLYIFPRSRFPFRMQYQLNPTLALNNGEFQPIGWASSFGFEQKYTPKGKIDRYTLGFNIDQAWKDDQLNSERAIWHAQIANYWSNQKLINEVKWEKTLATNSFEDTQSEEGVLRLFTRHKSTPSINFNSDATLELFDEKTYLPELEKKQMLQLTSVANWRPQATTHTTMTTSGRWYENLLQDSNYTLRVVSNRWNWQPTKKVQFDYNFNNEFERLEANTEQSVQQSLGGGYRSNVIKHGDFSYHNYARSSVSHAKVTTNTLKRYSETATADVGQDLQLGSKKESGNYGSLLLDQRLAWSDEDLSITSDHQTWMLHRLTYSTVGEGWSSFATLEDHHYFDPKLDELSDSQRLGVGWRQSKRVSLFRTLNGSINAEYSREKTLDIQEPRYQYNVNTDLIYADTQFFDVRNLNFESSLRVTETADSNTENFGSLINRMTLNTDIKIKYKIGSVKITGTGAVAISAGSSSINYHVVVRRDFRF